MTVWGGVGAQVVPEATLETSHKEEFVGSLQQVRVGVRAWCGGVWVVMMDM